MSLYKPVLSCSCVVLSSMDGKNHQQNTLGLPIVRYHLEGAGVCLLPEQLVLKSTSGEVTDGT